MRAQGAHQALRQHSEQRAGQQKRLNPHVYLDTLGLIGAISTQYDMSYDRNLFGIGAVFASFVFFFGLGYGARYLAPVMKSPRAWRVLDVLIGLVMWALAIKLIS